MAVKWTAQVHIKAWWALEALSRLLQVTTLKIGKFFIHNEECSLLQVRNQAEQTNLSDGKHTLP